MVDLKDQDLAVLSHENEMLEDFAEKYLADAMRIIATRCAREEDHELIYDAICIATAMYMKKLKDGEVHKDRMIH